ncbi:hypothetical protein MPSEU_000643600 [Mayamaea pseudoterrestris]|nr:hypothetical protein MPSEU_000643600 [Mayamaea pseudoterrestris]
MSFDSTSYLTAANLLLPFYDKTINDSTLTSSRRNLFASSLIAAGTFLAAADAGNAATLSNVNVAYSQTSKLVWSSTPVNKRYGVTVFDAEQAGYNVPFVTYLSRFLLCFDQDCQRWWYNRAADIPRTANRAKVNELRLAQFAAFSASVAVGLQEYRDPKTGSKTLMQSLLSRYCPDVSQMEAVRAIRYDAGQSMSDSEMQREDREIKEARRQIALLFGLLEENQPVEDITKLLAAIDNGSITSVRIVDPGSGYAPGYGPPEVKFPPPEAGEGYETATGRATLRPNGKILRIDIVNRGGGYTKPPTVTVAPPASIRFGDAAAERAETAEAKVLLFRSGVNKGRIERIQLINPGAGYTANEIIKVRIDPPDAAPQEGGITATATAVLEYQVGDIVIVNNGTGYAVEKPISVFVEPPPITARVNMNDPLMARIVAPDKPLPATTIPSKEMRRKMPPPEDPSSMAYRLITDARADGKGGAGGCIGRGCYDSPVIATAYPRAERDSYNMFRNEDDARKPRQIENALEIRGATAFQDTQRMMRVSASGDDKSDSSKRVLDFGLSSPSTELLSLLPAGVGLEFNSEVGRYQLVSDPTVIGIGQDTSKKALDPDFGPRGRSPIEKEMDLGLDTYLRFVASGAICCSGVHLLLTPIDVLKTKVQTDPVKYPGVVKAFQRISQEEGVGTFFTGWVPTFLGFFVWGGVSYALTEFLRRALTVVFADNATQLEVLIILLASGAASFLGCFVICPFEAVRIRSVAQPDYARSIVDVFKRIVKEEGVSSLFSAVPVFFTKEIPFAMAKFTVFDISTTMLYEAFPAANEDLQLSLLVSLAGGTLGGFCAAVVSNPADVIISEMKKSKNDSGPVAAASMVLERGGPPSLFRGLPLRLVFYALIVSLQFLVYDAVRFALGIGKDDLKLYLDVLGGALSEGGGPV